MKKNITIIILSSLLAGVLVIKIGNLYTDQHLKSSTPAEAKIEIKVADYEQSEECKKLGGRLFWNTTYNTRYQTNGRIGCFLEEKVIEL